LHSVEAVITAVAVATLVVLLERRIGFEERSRQITTLATQLVASHVAANALSNAVGAS